MLEVYFRLCTMGRRTTLLHKHFYYATDTCCNLRERQRDKPRAKKGSLFLAIGPERGLQLRLCDILYSRINGISDYPKSDNEIWDKQYIVKLREREGQRVDLARSLKGLL